MAAARPVLGVIACTRQVGTEPAQAVMERYIRAAMRHADVAALIVPSLADLMSAAEIAPRLDGILLTGSPSNVEPVRYEDDGGEGPFDPGRDEIALDLVGRMIDLARPVFGICRGFQEINVALGGTLRRDTSANDDLIRHHAPDGAAFDAMFDHLHPVHLSEGGMIARALGKADATVNSVHYQGIGRLAPGLVTEATAPDGLVEAYSARPNGAPLVAVQWHPEWDADSNPDSAAYFHLLGKALRGEA
ncbi:gamma-glutamyl-gamma-aminobutyrate hydrolase family protein [Novosphingobium sp.]|uniref:gamma-glutamyl-gamma-aminobutyrate hydrolase family protein n=1 Tax=Novosphingobium sp. TaxID=1874826 RepID=UPI0025DC9409|nr:gamma-glutamyl-gamma-aminobutyrate hydrolase family protein [Novosphingobium sp.]